MDFLKEFLLKELKGGSSRIEIAKKSGYSLATIGRYIKKYNLKKEKLNLDKKWIEEKYFKDGLSTTQIAKLLGLEIKNDQILYQMRVLGIKRRVKEEIKGKFNPQFGKPKFNRRGENHSNWQGGTTGIGKMIRNCIEYKDWRMKILKRDNFTCQICKIRGGGVKLNVDHFPKALAVLIVENNIYKESDINNYFELWEISNGRTLCLECHKKTETWGGNLSGIVSQRA